MSETDKGTDYRAFVAKPGDMEPGERAALAEKLPQYLTREQAAELANVHVRTIDRWRRWWAQSFLAADYVPAASKLPAGSVGLKTYYSRATGHDMAEHPPGDVRVSKVQLLERIGFTAPEQHREAPKTIAQASREMFG